MYIPDERHPAKTRRLGADTSEGYQGYDNNLVLPENGGKRFCRYIWCVNYCTTVAGICRAGWALKTNRQQVSVIPLIASANLGT